MELDAGRIGTGAAPGPVGIEALPPEQAGTRWRSWIAVALLLAAACTAMLLYRGGGSVPDEPPANDIDALAAMLAGVGRQPSLAQLEAQAGRSPRDGRAWVLLARRQFEFDRFDAAARAYEKALAVSPKVARDPLVWCEFADAVGMAQGGTLAGRPRSLIGTALAIDANHPRALEMAGSAEYEAGNFARTLAYWEPLLAQLPPGSAASRELAVAVARVRQLTANGEFRGNRARPERPDPPKP
jgi:cytochrome c-type biogenesis protein CcmH